MSSRGMEGPSSGSWTSWPGGDPAVAGALCCIGPLFSACPVFSMPSNCCDALVMAADADADGAEAREACRGWLPCSEGGPCAGTDPTDRRFRPSVMYLLETEVGTRPQSMGASREFADSAAIPARTQPFSVGGRRCLISPARPAGEASPCTLVAPVRGCLSLRVVSRDVAVRSRFMCGCRAVEIEAICAGCRSAPGYVGGALVRACV